jgi:thiamine-monophosphate kinase
VVLGIGDDVAVLRYGDRDYLLATCDSQVEDIHFRRDRILPAQLGRRIAAINLSDIAAMGGVPRWALVSLAVPEDLEVSYLEELYVGLGKELQDWGAAVVGGNLSRHERQVVIDLSLLGTVPREHLVCRDGAGEGDLIVVTGSLGDSRAGLALLSEPRARVSRESAGQVIERHLTPRARVREGQLLGQSGRVHAMVDVSDGCWGDLMHICRRSGVGAELWLDTLPVSAACREVATAVGADPGRWALGGGEDYELLFTVAANRCSDVVGLLAAECGTSCTVIGRVTGLDTGVQILTGKGGRRLELPASMGWDHFLTGASAGT